MSRWTTQPRFQSLPTSASRTYRIAWSKTDLIWRKFRGRKSRRPIWKWWVLPTNALSSPKIWNKISQWMIKAQVMDPHGADLTQWSSKRASKIRTWALHRCTRSHSTRDPTIDAERTTQSSSKTIWESGIKFKNWSQCLQHRNSTHPWIWLKTSLLPSRVAREGSPLSLLSQCVVQHVHSLLDKEVKGSRVKKRVS